MFAKLYKDVLTSSLTEEVDIRDRGVFFMLLAAADRKGYVLGTDKAIARSINVPVEVLTRAIDDVLAKPDPDSQSKEYEGRRVVRLENQPGLFIVNYEKYSTISTDEQRREYFRVKKQESRERQKAAEAATNGETAPPPATPPAPPPTKTTVVVNAVKFVKPTREQLNEAAAKIGLPSTEVDMFVNFYESNGWKVGKNSMKSWTAALSVWYHRWRKENPQGGADAHQMEEHIEVPIINAELKITTPPPEEEPTP